MTFDTYALQKSIMQATLISNITTLQNYFPEIIAFYETFELKGNEICLDDNGSPNIINNGNYVYDDVKGFSHHQVEQFITEVKGSAQRVQKSYYVFDIAAMRDSEINFKHEKVLKDLNSKRKKETFFNHEAIWDEEVIDCFFMVGSGLGYQIEYLFKEKNIVNFFLYEPSPEVFWGMLHCIELKPLIERCLSLAGNFSITIGYSHETALNKLHNFLSKHGHFNICRMPIYKHYESETTEKLIQLLKDIGHRLSYGFGFMEDEIIGISHTLSNIKANYPLMKKGRLFDNDINDLPILVAANGPSLDQQMALIKENKDKFYIISCGSSLRPLLTNGIRPDVHIEMERTAATIPWLDSIEQQYELSKIPIIALSPVCTEVLERFSSVYLVAKKYDFSGYIIANHDEENELYAPDYMNPTVTNCALTVLLSLGFNNIYLIGVDLGFKSLEHHHSKDSMYYDENAFSKKETDSMFVKELCLEGNFGGKVYTTKIFEQSRGNLELLIDKYPEAKVHNCSDGIKIRKTIPTYFNDIPFTELQLKDKEALNNLFGVAFKYDILNASILEKDIQSAIEEIKEVMDILIAITDVEVTSRRQLHLLFSKQYLTLFNEIKKRITYAGSISVYLQGSLKYFQALIMANSYYYTDLEKRNEYVNYALNVMKEHFYDIYGELKNDYDKPSKV